MVSLPARPENSSAVPLGLSDPVMVSAKEEPDAELTPEKVSVPTDASPVTVPDAPLLVLVQLLRLKVIVTPAVALKYAMRVLWSVSAGRAGWWRRGAAGGLVLRVSVGLWVMPCNWRATAARVRWARRGLWRRQPGGGRRGPNLRQRDRPRPWQA